MFRGGGRGVKTCARRKVTLNNIKKHKSYTEFGVSSVNWGVFTPPIGGGACAKISTFTFKSGLFLKSLFHLINGNTINIVIT